ncbi:MAG: hypothetical protein QGG62_04105 [Candidatus Poseidoniaceae archaeon]|jgi:hypothetical protein|nr:hypothetical protein [Candidatus Poseidoniaceae archaeon]
MAKRSMPDEIALDDIMQESVKEMGKGEVKQEENEQQPVETTQQEHAKPQFGFKLGEVETPASFVVAAKKEERKKKEKEQVILDKPSQGLDDDIIVDW